MKVLIRIFNLIYIALAAVACITLITNPLLKMDGTMALSKSDISGLLKDPLSAYLTEEEITNCLVFKEGEQVVEKLTINVSISFPTSLVFDSKNTENTEKVITEQLSPLVEDTVKDLKPSINNMAEVIVKKEAKGPLTNAINDQIRSVSTDMIDTSQLDEWGIGEEYMEEVIGEMFDIILEGGGTVDDLVEELTDSISHVCEVLKEQNVEGFEDYESQIDGMTEAIKEELQTTLESIGFCDEEGNLMSVEDYLVKLLDDALSEEEDSSVTKSLKRVKEAETNETSKEEAVRRLTDKITELLANKLRALELPDKVSKYGVLGGAFIGFLAIPWVVLALVTFIRTLRKNKCWTKTWFVFSFAWITLLLGVVLTVATKNFLPKFTNLIPAGAYKDVLKGLSVTIKTSAYVPSILFLIMIPLTIVYAVFRHKAKRDYKKSK